MITEEQKELSDYIKRVHLSLRCKSRQIGAETAWKQHTQNEEVLRNYAVCMKNLAENYWSVNNKKEKYLCRIQWMIVTIKEYFKGNLLQNELSKVERKLNSFILRSLINEDELGCLKNPYVDFKEPYKVLDVGSCYNPLGGYDFLSTFSLDLFPAVPSVKKCDFTQLRVEDFLPGDDSSWFCDGLKRLPFNFFDIVVFSLFLEYLPSPGQRFYSCQIAYKALKTNGLLLIATPDSKHESANAGIMKSWKIALGRIGFVRVKLEKLKYMYCMAFRKSASHKYPHLLYNIKEGDEINAIPIPQDSVDYKTEENSSLPCFVSKENVKYLFEELPFSKFDVNA